MTTSERLRQTSFLDPSTSSPEDSPVKTYPLQDQEKELIEAALAKSRVKVAGPGGAAATLGIPASTLESKIKQLGIAKGRFTSLS